MSSYNQKVIAVDTKFNKYRGAASSGFRSTYLKRRIQLLSNSRSLAPPCSCCSPSSVSKDQARPSACYLQLRTQLLRRQVRSQGRGSDLQSTSSFSFTTGEVKATPCTQQGSKALSVTFEGDGMTSLPSEAYDFHGFHHVSDLHRAAVTRLMFAHNDQDTLIASSLDGTLSVYRMDEEPPKVSLTLSGHTKGVTDFDISTSNELLVSCAMDGTLCLWRLSDGQLMRRVCSTPRSSLTSARFLPGNNNLVVTGGDSGLVQITNMSTGTFPQSGTSTVAGSVLCLAAATQDSLVWAGTNRGTVLSFKVDCLGGGLSKGHRTLVSQAQVTCLSCRPSTFSGRSMLLASAGLDSLFLYLVTDQLGSLQLHRTFPVVHSTLAIRSTFAPLMSYRSGDCVVSASEDGAVYFFDVSKSIRACINKLEAHSCPGLAVAFNYNETYLATSDKSGLVIVWKR